MLATKKICDHVLALMSYHKYEKKANYENQQHNFIRIDDFDN